MRDPAFPPTLSRGNRHGYAPGHPRRPLCVPRAREEQDMTTAETIQQRLEPMFPGLMGIDIEDATPDRVTARLRVRPALCTAGDILHGGALMALADTLGAVGTLLNMPQGKRTTTTDSSTKFMAPAPLETTVAAECRPLHLGRTTMVWQTEVRTDSGRLCAVITQTQLVLDG
ncbi:PaaI family thioesterase [Ectothiorhodospiraceae bacterium WFHF3C12]|nr:PaaI family thioesterase [Ectothiorhodospiraceae bacterium WFHF3C12]